MCRASAWSRLGFGLVLGWIVLLAACGDSRGAETAAASHSLTYQRELKPLLRGRCVACHGPVTQEGGLRLDAARLLITGSDQGPVIVAGSSETSRLIERVTASDPAERMPPKGAALTDREVQLLRTWIDAGAPIPEDEVIVPRPQAHWSFQPLQRPSVPPVTDTAWPTNPIDRFVLAKLEARGWRPNPSAEPTALLRRLYLDLRGLPPSLEEQQAFLQDTEPHAYERLVDRLLADPGHGERYARHWLDVVRYADSNGYERDAVKPQVYRYRDYVIETFNDDVPFARFVLEQMAGDELPDADARAMIATGFHRLGPWDDEPADFATDRFDQLDDLVSTTGQTFLGLTLGCARCHDHKFDPLTQRDYYGLVAVFNPLQRPRQGRTELTLPIAPPTVRRQWTEEQRKAAPQGYFWDEPAGSIPATHILIRGNPHQRGDQVQPAAPVVLAPQPIAFLPATEATSRRRLSLAQWLVDRSHPLTARVLVNRVWQWHFGEGLVRTPQDFGLTGERPTHPELLDWLATWFLDDAEGSLKRLHQLIVTSQTYRQSRQDRAEYGAVDPENRLLWRRSLQRLEVEPMRDSMLAVSGQLNRQMYGPAIYPLIPAEALEGHADKASIWPAYDERAAARRTVYAFTKRSLLVPLLEVFDLCDTTRSSPQRSVTTVPTQALSLYNGQFVIQQATHFARRLHVEAGPDLDAQLTLAWRLSLCRTPTETERAALKQFVADQLAPPTTETTDSTHAAEESHARQIAALVQLCRVLFNLNEFVYTD
jgi:mono/diheme cytochrome c family protein